MDLCREAVWDTPNDGRLEEDRTNAIGVLTTPTIDSAASNARSSNHDSDKNNGNSIPVCKKRSSNEKQNSGRAYISETTPANTSQSIGPIASQTKTPTLGAIAHSCMPKSLGLISVDGKNPWTLHLGATDHLTCSLKHFISLKGNCSPNLVCLHSSTKWSGRTKNRHLVEVARSLMLSTSLPSYLWGDAILTTTHLINKMPSRILHLQTPLDCLKESYPSTRLVSEVPLRVFGCTAYVHNFGPNQTKFTPRAQACVFVGYPLHQCGYQCFHLLSRKYFITMDVTLCENRPYFPVSHL
ncbi:reverse transcriptase [Cucumis melo var. makuwa]|uniref:Reverse transcriptase n=1 Tax=Cucumis melo var. makuwa TaxID=1194695 RepID=A0A5A7SX10_CUCMM|nr:reverse transcriptase [Cucumis melo var. makuwa]